MTDGKGGKEKLLEVSGIIAIVYGIGTYLVESLSWPVYGAFIAGGMILVFLAWAKRSMQE
ncbi:MAG: hypothetical protein A2958_01765 [Candidatus Levybacteria bacterium RIFCSPLOWO2_01_FULL_38_13]|nr:MAG: hypothetical protein A2629_01305 [Candidatus Levybacteria bacterium RIFCSPHIGHO2_01_FULL_41_15]OGH34671.1 MAG: hypothetical protein A2958_01765 [Candidatus Levybacteria bacterium RIFCSPLOWO2_01_FULL_38_13]